MWSTSEQKFSRTWLIVIIAVIVVVVIVGFLIWNRQRELRKPVTDRESQVQALLEETLPPAEQLERQAQIAEILKQERSATTKPTGETILWDVLQ